MEPGTRAEEGEKKEGEEEEEVAGGRKRTELAEIGGSEATSWATV